MAAPQVAIVQTSRSEPQPVEIDPVRSRALDTLVAGLAPEVRSALCQASELERRRRAQLDQEPLPTTVPALDRALGGGLPRGAMVELVGRGSCGRMASLLAAIKATTDNGEVAALVDLGDHLDPQAAAEVGIELERLLWLRPGRLGDALAAAESLVNTGFTLVALDLGLPPVKGWAPLAAWLRLARSATAQRSAVLVSSPYRLSGCAATTTLTLRGRRGRWFGAVGSPRLLIGVNASFEANRQASHDPGKAHGALLVVPETVLGTTWQPPSRRSNVDRRAASSSAD